MEMKKPLVIGIILLFIGVAVAPSFNQSVVKASNGNDLVEIENINSYQLSPKRMNNNQTKDTVNNLVGLSYLRHPILLKIIAKLNYVRLVALEFLQDRSAIWFHRHPTQITHPLMFLLAIVLALRIGIGVVGWFEISQLLNWGWTYEDIEYGG